MYQGIIFCVAVFALVVNTAFSATIYVPDSHPTI